MCRYMWPSWGFSVLVIAYNTKDFFPRVLDTVWVVRVMQKSAYDCIPTLRAAPHGMVSDINITLVVTRGAKIAIHLGLHLSK